LSGSAVRAWRANRQKGKEKKGKERIGKEEDLLKNHHGDPSRLMCM
jgi:hypothetical protein